LLRRYVHGPGDDQPILWYEGSGVGDRRWLHTDERGSVIAISNAAGTVTGVNSYDEYGIPGGTNSGRFQYTGQTWIPELGLYYYKARMYSPTLGRFMQADPIGYAAGMNLYAYVGSDPVNSVDPSGMLEVSCYWERIPGPSEGGEWANNEIVVTANKREVCEAVDDGGPKPIDLDQDLTAPPQEQCLMTNGLPSTCKPSAGDPPIRPVVKDYICSKLEAWQYGISGAFNLAFDERRYEVNGVKVNAKNSVMREGENFLFAARDGVDALAISAYAVGKIVTQLWEDTGPSFAAWRAGLEGRLHYGWSKDQWKGWCGA
jgi:RHS repeat-associated protein